MSKAIPCPHCNGFATLTDSADIYGGRSYGLIYLCRPCDAYVGVHRGTTEPKGTPADRETREARKRAHAAFDPIWQSRRMTRHEAYRWLAKRLGMTREEAHIGLFDVATCDRVVAVAGGSQVVKGGAA